MVQVVRAALLAGPRLLTAAALGCALAAAGYAQDQPGGPPQTEGPPAIEEMQGPAGDEPSSNGRNRGAVGSGETSLVDPHYLLDYLPAALAGAPRADTRTGLEAGMPVAAAVYADGQNRREVVIRQLARSNSGGAARESPTDATLSVDGRSFSLSVLGGQPPQAYAVSPEGRFRISVSGSVAGPEEARELLAAVDISGLLAFEPPQEGFESAELYAGVVPMRIRYPASWIMVDAGRTGPFARMLLLMSQPIDPAQLTEEPTSLLLGRRIAATVGVLPAQESFSTRDYMIRTPSLIPYRFRQSRPTVRPEPAPEHGEGAGFAAFRAIDFEGHAIRIHELVYKPGDRWVRLHLLVPEAVEFGMESTFRELAEGISVTHP